jgi:hypothetical protein
VVVALVVAYGGASRAQGAPSDKPDHPFKLATFETGGKVRVGMVLGTRVLDIGDAFQHVEQRFKLPRVGFPGEMRALIEQYDRLAPRLYQIANYFKTNTTDGLPFAFDAAKVSFKAPIKYPWNLLAAAANYKAHAEGMGDFTYRTKAEVADQAYYALKGGLTAEFYRLDNRRQFTILLRYREDQRRDLGDLEQVRIVGKKGEVVPLTSVVPKDRSTVIGTGLVRGVSGREA